MAKEDPFVLDLVARLEPLGEVSARRMFGGFGLYCEGVFFGVVDEGVAFFRVDETTVGDYRAAGSGPFHPIRDKPSMQTYFEVPLGVLERDEELRTWARKAVEAARRRAAEKKSVGKKKPEKRATRNTSAVPVAELLNIGPKSSTWLRAVGIETRADLERLGSVAAYRRVSEEGFESSLNLLYALEGALLELRWDRLPEVVKANLRERAQR